MKKTLTPAEKAARTRKRRSRKRRPFGQRVTASLRRLRKQRGLTTAQVAERSGIAERYIVGYESGWFPRSGPGTFHLDNACRVCGALDCSLDYIAGNTDDPGRAP